MRLFREFSHINGVFADLITEISLKYRSNSRNFLCDLRLKERCYLFLLKSCSKKLFTRTIVTAFIIDGSRKNKARYNFNI